MKNTNYTLSLISLLCMNLLPIAGILLFGWNLFVYLFLIWVETAIVGLFVALLILSFNGMKRQDIGSKIILAGLFCFLYSFILIPTSFFIAGVSEYIYQYTPHWGRSGGGSVIFGILNIFIEMCRHQPLGAQLMAIVILLNYALLFMQFHARKVPVELKTIFAPSTLPISKIVFLYAFMIICVGGITILQSPYVMLGLMVVPKLVMDLRFLHRQYKQQALETAEH